MNPYHERHHEDVATMLSVHRKAQPANAFGAATCFALTALAKDFAELFAIDNPYRCRRCNKPRDREADFWPQCAPHDYAGGFDRERFLKACRLGEA